MNQLVYWETQYDSFVAIRLLQQLSQYTSARCMIVRKTNPAAGVTNTNAILLLVIGKRNLVLNPSPHCKFLTRTIKETEDGNKSQTR